MQVPDAGPGIRVTSVLRIGLTGGIGAGKSAVASRLADLGAVVVDSDRIAREVVEPGTPGLAAVVQEFGQEILTADGALDRPKLGGVVFNDPAARARLNSIVHPLVGRRAAELVAAAPTDAVIAHDVPLLVENSLVPNYHLVVVVEAPEAHRIRRLVDDRGMTVEEVRARMSAQATDAQRRRAADILIENAAGIEDLRSAVDGVWKDRLAPYAANLAARRAAAEPTDVVPPDPAWPEEFARAAARLRVVLADPDLTVVLSGPTSEDGRAPDILELRAETPGSAELDSTLADAGWIAHAGEAGRYDAADPGRPARLYLTGRHASTT